MITSTKNIKVKEIRQLQNQAKIRKETASFVVEGVRLIEEAFHAGRHPKMLLYSEVLNQRGLDLVAQFQELEINVEMTAPHIIENISSTKNPQGILAVMPMESTIVPEKIDFVLVPDQIRDPGNLGTLLRTATAAGVQAIYIPIGTTDVFSPKVLRSGMGAHFQITIIQGDYAGLQSLCEKHSLRLIVTEANNGEVYTRANFKEPVALIIGGEANGVSKEIMALNPHSVTIPMPGKVESLNAAIAGGILLFEVVRQRNAQ